MSTEQRQVACRTFFGDSLAYTHDHTSTHGHNMADLHALRLQHQVHDRRLRAPSRDAVKAKGPLVVQLSSREDNLPQPTAGLLGKRTRSTRSVARTQPIDTSNREERRLRAERRRQLKSSDAVAF